MGFADGCGRLEGGRTSSAPQQAGRKLPRLRFCLTCAATATAIAAGPVGRASADTFRLAGPVSGETWGQQAYQPVASAPGRAGADLPPGMKLREWLAAYVGALAAMRETLDVARAHSWFTVPEPLMTARIGHAVALPPELQAVLSAKQAHAQASLLAELDQRFKTLAEHAEAATAIALPDETAEPVGRVRYCGWIEGLQMPASPLRGALRARCLRDRDAFLVRLVRHMAGVAAIPALPSPGEAMAATPQSVAASAGPQARDLSQSLRLPRSVIPGEVNAPFDYPGAVRLYRATLRTRFASSLPELEGQLRQSLAVLDASQVVATPGVACPGMLGAYDGNRIAPDLAGGVTLRLSQACGSGVVEQAGRKLPLIKAKLSEKARRALADVDATPAERIEVVRGPRAMCQFALQPYLQDGRADYAPSPLAGVAQLRQDCLSLAGSVVEAKLRRRAAFAIDQARPPQDTPQAWDHASWFALPPHGYGFIAGADPDLNAMQARYLQLYEGGIPEPDAKPGEASVRAATSRRFADAVEAAYAGAAYLDPPQARALCDGRYRTSGEAALDGLRPSTADGAVARIANLRAAHGLSFPDATSLIAQTCRLRHEALLRVRLSEAAKSSGADMLFAAGEMVAVSDVDGRLGWEPPAALVNGAAVDGVQVRFAQGGLLTSPSMTVTPFGRGSPALSGSLRRVTRDDGVEMLEVRGMESLPGLDGPFATLRCLGMPVAKEGFRGQMQALVGIALAGLSYWPQDGRAGMEQGMRTMDDAAACAAAKAAFAGR